MVLLKALAALLVIQAAVNAAENEHLAKKGQFPFHVSIQKFTNQSEGVAYEHVCSGALIKEDFVLTAANCVANDYTYVVRISALKHADPENRVVIGVKKTIIHENYKPKNNESIYNEHDIALLQLNEKLNFTTHADTSPVNLPNSKENLDKSKISAMIGYELTGTQEQGVLKFFNSSIIDNNLCKEALVVTHKDAVLYDSQFCVEEVKEHTVHTIKGDSGDTLVQVKDSKSILVGLAASYSVNVDSEGKSIFTQVSLYVDWIKSKTNGAFSITGGYLVLAVAAISIAKNLF